MLNNYKQQLKPLRQLIKETITKHHLKQIKVTQKIN